MSSSAILGYKLYKAAAIQPVSPIQPAFAQAQPTQSPEDAAMAQAQQAQEQQQIQDQMNQQAEELQRLQMENAGLKQEVEISHKREQLAALEAKVQGAQSQIQQQQAPQAPAVNPLEEENAKLRLQAQGHAQEMKLQKMTLEAQQAQREAEKALSTPAPSAGLSSATTSRLKEVSSRVGKLTRTKGASTQPKVPAAPVNPALVTNPPLNQDRAALVRKHYPDLEASNPKAFQAKVNADPNSFYGQTTLEERNRQKAITAGSQRLADAQYRSSQYDSQPQRWLRGWENYINDPDSTRSIYGNNWAGRGLNWVDQNLVKPTVRNMYAAGDQAINQGDYWNATKRLGAVTAQAGLNVMGGAGLKALGAGLWKPSLGGAGRLLNTWGLAPWIGGWSPDVYSNQFKVGDQYVSAEDELRRATQPKYVNPLPANPTREQLRAYYDPHNDETLRGVSAQGLQTSGYYNPRALWNNPEQVQFSPGIQPWVDMISPFVLPQVNYANFDRQYMGGPETFLERFYRQSPQAFSQFYRGFNPYMV